MVPEPWHSGQYRKTIGLSASSVEKSTFERRGYFESLSFFRIRSFFCSVFIDLSGLFSQESKNDCLALQIPYPDGMILSLGGIKVFG